MVSLVAILASLAAPAFTTQIANQRVTAAAQDLQTLFQFARAQAVYTRTQNTVSATNQTWEAKVGTQLLREAVMPEVVTATPNPLSALTFDVLGGATPVGGNAPYKVTVSAPKASRVQCLSVTRAGLVRQQRVAVGQACP